MGIVLYSLFACALLPQAPRSSPVAADAVADSSLVAPVAESGLVLVARGASLPAAFRLGDGGGEAAVAAAAGATLRGVRGTCTTPGGVQVRCQREGVKLTFPSGRELLWAPDGHLHLRDGSVGGPFEGGIELRLFDGSAVRILRGGSRRTPIESVVVVAGGDGVRLWRRGEPLFESDRGSWFGERAWCLGDGDALYRALALGPVVTLDRLLAPRDTKLPRYRLALEVGPLLDSMQALAASRARLTDAEAVGEVSFVLANAERALPCSGPPPVRTSTSPLRFLVRSGYEFEFRLDGGDVRLRMARHGLRPFAEWQLGYGAAVCCVQGAMQPAGNLVTLAPVAPELQPRLERFELVPAITVLRGLEQGAR